MIKLEEWPYNRDYLVPQQGTIQGFQSRGFSLEESEALLRRSVEVACEARDMFQGQYLKASSGISEGAINSKQRPVLVAASIGSYGAYLADGSEYRCIF